MTRLPLLAVLALSSCMTDVDDFAAAEFRGGPFAFASPELLQEAYTAVVGGPGDWQVCSVGTYFAGTTYRICCPHAKDSDCRVITNGDQCLAVEDHMCDRPVAFDTHACLNGAGLYIKGPKCNAGDTFVCPEGDYSAGPTAVCCADWDSDDCVVVANGVCAETQVPFCYFDAAEL
jgi:hypothetical protein